MIELPYLLPYFVSFFISAGICVYAWTHRHLPGARLFTAVALAQTVWILGSILEFSSNTLTGKIFWDNFQYLGTCLWIPALFAFTLRYTGRQMKQHRLTWILIGLVEGIFLLLVVTSPWHNLIRTDTTLVNTGRFLELSYRYPLPIWIFAVFLYGLLFISAYFLVDKYFHTHRLYRVQIAIILVGTLIPVIGITLTLFDLRITPFLPRDTSPFTFAVGNLFIAWGLFRYQLFSIVPVAHDLVVKSMSDAVITLDEQDRLVDINPAAQKLIDVSAKDVIGQPAEQVYAGWPALLARFKHVQEVHTEIEIKEGQNVSCFDLRFKPLHNHLGQPAGRLIVVRDITKRKQVEQSLIARKAELEIVNKELADANERLQVLSNIKDEFVANVSHELRTPISNIQLYHDLLGRQQQIEGRYMETLRHETRRLSVLIENLLALSRLDQNRTRFTIQAVDLNALAQEYVTDRQAMASKRGLTLQFSGADNLPAAKGDPDLLGQALSVLLTNALNYTPAGGEVTVSTRFCEEDEGERPYVALQVTDTGPGIPPEDKERLFARFFRGKAGTESEVSGTGLGLSIAKKIVEQHQGKIEVESEGIPGQGATFIIKLPL
ncbi:MAG: PAS domain S-box protein [Anaerolineaceae bacterium]|nr:PAS domain S-box protein [Anaerolineaceae bacterium]